MRTQGEIEAAICEGTRRFEQEYMGRGPKDIRAYVIDNCVVIRLHGVLAAAEQHLVKSLPAEKGRDLLKQMRIHLIETARPLLEALVLDATGVKVVSLHHDICTVTGEEVVVFTLVIGVYISNLVASGASVKTCQVLARHSTPSLIIGIYAKASLHDISGAVSTLPDPTADGPAPEAMAATGTEGGTHRKTLCPSPALFWGRNGAGTVGHWRK